ncbi:hypothetical protein EVAR_17286_1 [Eumeta japonica]|uniref:Uncharacterized protein n=1 Tax=Eumeta variegata TaxID=151549 RepID=A0A4C1TTD6_EUMVA|nr:hypothetical protein EVAR_17286_1 [Eumeta japonica]
MRIVKRLLVGAPEDDTRRRPEVKRPGSVYRCEPTYADQCREIIFDNLQVRRPSSEIVNQTAVAAGAGVRVDEREPADGQCAWEILRRR